MSSQIRYKFRSQTAYDLLQFDGHGVTVGEVKVMIAEKKGLGSDAIQELVLHNPSLKIDYTDDTKQLLKNTSVVVRRVPVAQRPLKPLVGATPAPVAVVSALAATSPQPDSFADASVPGQGLDGGDAAMYTEDAGPMVPANVQAFIENAAKAIFSSDQLNTQQQASGRGGGRGGGRWGGPGGRGGGRSAAPTYVCSRCGGLGHFLNDCPTKDDAAFDKRYRHPAGIPTCKIQRNADGGLFLPDGEAGEMAPNLTAFQNLAAMLPNAPRNTATPDLSDQLSDAATPSTAIPVTTSSAPPSGSGPVGEAGMFMPSLVLPAPLPNLATPSAELPTTAAPDTLMLGLFGDEEEQHAPAPHASLALGMGTPADLASSVRPLATAEEAFPSTLLRDTLNPSMLGVPDDLLGVGCDLNTFMHLLPALEPVIPKAPIKYLVKLFASGRPLTPLEFTGLQHSIGKDIAVAAVRERKHTSKPGEGTVKREEKKKRRHSSRSPSPSELAEGDGIKLTHKRSADSGFECITDPASLEQRMRRREDLLDDRREVRHPQQVPSQRYEPQHADPRFEPQHQDSRGGPQGQDFRGHGSLHSRYDFPQQEFRGNSGPRASRPPDFPAHMGPFRQQPPPPSRENSRMAQEREDRIAQDWDSSLTLATERDNNKLRQQRESRFAEREGIRATRASSPPLTRRPSSSSIHSLPKAALPAGSTQHHSHTPAMPPPLKTQHSSSSGQRIKQEPAASEKDRDRPASTKILPASSKRHSSPPPLNPPAHSPARVRSSRRSPTRSSSRSRASSPARSPVRSRPRSNGGTERWQVDAEQSAGLEQLPVRVPRTVSSPAAASAAVPRVQASTPDHDTAEPAVVEDGQGGEEGVGGSISRWGEGDGDDGMQELELDYDDELMEDCPEDPLDDLLQHPSPSRACEQQQGVLEDESKPEGPSVRLSSPSSAEGPAVLPAVKSEPSDDRKQGRLGARQEGRSVSPVGKGQTDNLSDRKGSKRHKRHKEGKEHKAKHKSKRHKSLSPVVSSSPPPVARAPTPEVRAPTPELEVVPQPLPDTTQPDRPEKRKHHHKSSSSRHRSDRKDGDIKREDKESDRDIRRSDRELERDIRREDRESDRDVRGDDDRGGGGREQRRSASEVNMGRDGGSDRQEQKRSVPDVQDDKVKSSKSGSTRSPTISKSKHRSSSRRS